MADCDYTSQIGAYYDGELPPEQRAAVERHLPTCPPCGEELESLRGLSSMFGTASATVPLSAAGLSCLHEEVEHWIHERRDRRLIHIARVLTAMAACLLVGASVWIYGARQAPAAPPARPWEQVAVTLQTEIPSAGGTDLAMDWVVADASRSSLGE